MGEKQCKKKSHRPAEKWVFPSLFLSKHDKRFNFLKSKIHPEGIELNLQVVTTNNYQLTLAHISFSGKKSHANVKFAKT